MGFSGVNATTDNSDSLDTSRAWIWLPVVLFAATAVISPFFYHGPPWGHDLQYHLASWMDTAGQWREGIFYPRWAEWSNWGFGEPRFVFYPPASWLIGAALGLALPWRFVQPVFFWMALVLCGVSMWKLAREWLPAPQALLAAIFYVVNPYHLVIVYYRSDFAELLVCGLLPLFLLGLLRLTVEGWRPVPWLALVVGAIWMCNAPAAVIASYSAVAALLVLSLLHRTAKPLLMGLVSLASGMSLAAFYIVPAALEQRWVEIERAALGRFDPFRNFLFSPPRDESFLFFNEKISKVAVMMMALAALAAAASYLQKRKFRDLWWILAALLVVSSTLMFRQSAWIYALAPKLPQIQFPWRWLAVLGLAFAFFLAAASVDFTSRWRPRIVLAIAVAGFAVTAHALLRDAKWNSRDADAVFAQIHSGRGYGGTIWYVPRGADPSALPGTPDSVVSNSTGGAPDQVSQLNPATGDLERAEEGSVHIEQWTAEHKRFSEQSNVPIILAPKVLNYPAWRVSVDDGTYRAPEATRAGQIEVALPAGTHSVDLRFSRTWDCTAGNIVSALTALGLVCFFFLARGKQTAA